MRFLVCSAVLAGCLAGQSALAALTITEVASTSGAPAGTLSGLDWWELTNTGPGSVSLNGYAWEDSPIANDRAIFPNGITVVAGESIIVHQGTGATVAADFRTAWGLGASVQVLVQSQFGGPNPFSGLSSSNDEVNLFDSAPALVDNATFGASTSGVTFEWDGSGASLGLSVNGQNGAYLSNYGGVGSPGSAVIPVPEPTTMLLIAGAVCALIGCASRSRK
jgi:Lamin Tail Domain/PEP-CTERM motif